MASDSVDISDEMRKKIAEHPEINWNQIISNFIQEYIHDLEKMEAELLTCKSELIETDIAELAEEVEKSAWQRLQKKLSIP